MLKTEHTHCNLCGSIRCHNLYSVKGFNVVTCSDCSLVFINPRYTKEELEKQYSEDYFKQFSTQRKVDYMKDREFRRHDFLTRMKGIRRFKKSGRILDVGCAAGFFLEIAREQGWETKGVELSGYASSFARKDLGLEVITGELQDARFSRDYFDVITFFDVIEHVRDPGKLLGEAFHILKKKGIVVITTPNIKSACARIFKERFHLLDPLHLYYFSPLTIKKLLHKKGFKVIRIEYPYFKTPYFNPRELLKLAKNMVSLKVMMPLKKVFGKKHLERYKELKSCSFYGNMMSIYAAKR